MPDAVLQQKLTEVFFLFPEFIDDHHQSSAPYIKNMEYDYDEVYPRCINNIVDLKKFFSYERHVNMYYDKKNIDGMLYPYEELGFPDIDIQVRTMLRDCDVLDWRTELDGKETEIEWRGNMVSNDTCAFVYERSHIDNPDLLVHATLFSVEDAIECDGKEIIFKKGNVVCSLDCQITKRDLHAWLSEYRLPQRSYRYNPKHGENGINDKTFLPNGMPAAVLECDSEHAQKMLCKAIGDIDVDNNLWYYDSKNKKMIYFEFQNESPQNEYHCYHISPGDKRYDKVNIDLLRIIQDDIP